MLEAEEQKKKQNEQKSKKQSPFLIDDDEKPKNVDVSFQPKQTQKQYDGVPIEEQNKPIQQNKGKGKKKKYVAYIEPGQLSVSSTQQTAPKKSSGPSFSDLMAMEEKAQTKKPASANKSFDNEQSANYDVSFNPKPRFGTTQTTMNKSQKKSGFDFNSLLESEMKQNKKEQQSSQKSGSSKFTQSSFDDLMRKEEEKESMFDQDALQIVDTLEKPVFKDPEAVSRTRPQKQKKNSKGKGKNKKADDDMFWGGGSDDEIVEEVGFRSNDFPSLAAPAPGQKRKNYRQFEEAQQRVQNRAEKAPASFLQKHLEDLGFDEQEAEETAEALSKMNKPKMLDALRSLLPDQSKAEPIVNAFFRSFPSR